MQVLIRFQKGQGLGNQLWLLAAGLLYAGAQYSKLKIIEFENFKAPHLLNLAELEKFCEIGEQPTGQIAEFKEKMQQNRYTGVAQYYYQTNKTKSECFLLEGNFQRIEILTFSRPIMTKVLHIKLAQTQRIKDCIISVRGGEYKTNRQLLLHRDYFCQAIKYMKHHRDIENFYICTDDAEYAKELALPDTSIIQGDMISDFNHLATAHNVISSNSSFVHWPLAINTNCPFVIAPEYWARHNSLVDTWPNPGNYIPDYNWMSKDGKIVDQATSNNKYHKNYTPRPTVRDKLSTTVFKLKNYLK